MCLRRACERRARFGAPPSHSCSKQLDFGSVIALSPGREAAARAAARKVLRRKAAQGACISGVLKLCIGQGEKPGHQVTTGCHKIRKDLFAEFCHRVGVLDQRRRGPSRRGPKLIGTGGGSTG